jgi:hypothetical protein
MQAEYFHSKQWPMAVSATAHCLIGCAIGEILGMIIGTAFGLDKHLTIILAISLAFLFGYSLTSLPLIRAGLPFKQVVKIALATDTVSITSMEIIDNLIMLIVPGAMTAGLDRFLFWGSLSLALSIAAVLTVPVNHWLIQRNKGHMVLHHAGHHADIPVKLIVSFTLTAFVFGLTTVILSL